MAPPRIQIRFATALLVLFVALVVVMILFRNAPENTWKNLVYTFGAVEALVFTAVGWVFGREVHRAQAAAAEDAAKEAKGQAQAEATRAQQADTRANDEAMKTVTLKTGIRMYAQRAAGTVDPDEQTRGIAPSALAPDPALTELLRLADET
jgi:high-affinity K+ transport system ATPase subunit B